MSITIETKQNQDGSFSPTTIENPNELEQFVNHGSRLIGVLQVIENEVVNSTNRLNQAVRTNENVIQRYWNTETIYYEKSTILKLNYGDSRIYCIFVPIVDNLL